MAREYMINPLMGGPYLQITGEDEPEQQHKLHAASDRQQLREAEEIINKQYYGGRDPFPGFDWQPMKPDGWRTTDHDYRG